MKRNLLCILMVLFILAACQPIPKGLNQAATVTQESKATVIPTTTFFPEPIPTKENLLSEVEFFTQEQVKEMFEKDQSMPELTRLTIDELFSENIQNQEDEWIKDHPFSENTVPMSAQIKTENFDKTKFSFITLNRTDPSIDYVNNINARPIKEINYYVLWDEDFFNQSKYFESFLEFAKEMTNNDPKSMEQISKTLEIQKKEKYPFIGITRWAIYNIDGTTSKIYSITPYDLLNYIVYDIMHQNYQDGKMVTWEEDIKPNFVFETETHDSKLFFDKYALPEALWKLYPNLSPATDIQKWVESGVFPSSLENKIFSSTYQYYNPWWN